MPSGKLCTGMLPGPPRIAARYRMYDRDHCKRSVFIRRARPLGFSLTEMRRKIANLQRLKSTLQELTEQCSRGRTSERPILVAPWTDAALCVQRSTL